MATWLPPPVPSFRHVLVAAIAIRVVLILYSEWHDAHSVVKYTDVDYRVFTDAAAFLWNPSEDGNHAQGPWGSRFHIGDPYRRETYRYTPLLALLATPNGWLHQSFGKYLFAVCDIVNGLLIYLLLKTEVIPGITPRPSQKRTQQNDVERQATLYSAIHLLNPMVFSISTRGSSESVLSTFVLFTLYTSLKGRWDASAVLLGLSTHWKIYPLVYGVSCVGVVGSSNQSPRSLTDFLKALINRKTFRFVFISIATFISLGAACYAVWGYPFLYESYLYHLHRLDHRHNFSPYFYLTYLTYPSITDNGNPATSTFQQIVRSPLTSFLPQMGLALVLGLLFGSRKEDLPFTWFIQTVVFVVFNKVCTSQYFLWYLLFVPLIIPRLSATKTKATLWVAVWVATQALWLAEAYRLEFLGDDVFFSLWVRGLIYVAGNCWILASMMQSYIF